jgi:hypothetical protein
LGQDSEYFFIQGKVRKAAPSCGIDITKTIRHNRQKAVLSFIIWVRGTQPSCRVPFLTVDIVPKEVAIFPQV